MNAESLSRWFEDDGDNTHCITYPLTENSVVFDVGGYEGNWAYSIVKKYNPYVFVFEPVKKFYDTCTERFKDNPKVCVHNYGLAGKDEEVNIVLDFDRSGVYTQGEDKELIALKDVVSSVSQPVDLISINIEGGEYVLLSRMLDSGIVKMFNNIQVQFHDSYPNCEELREEIRSKLRATHVERYCYPFVWESWSRVQT